MAQHRTPSKTVLKWWDRLGTLLVNLIGWLLAVAFLLPLIYMLVTAIQDERQFTDPKAPLWPVQQITYSYNNITYTVYHVPTPEGDRHWALVNRRRTYSEFIDPADPSRGLIRWEGWWSNLKPVYRVHITFDNFVKLWQQADFMRLVRNSLAITLMAGTASVLASILVAYGFARFPIPAGGFLFMLLIATIMIPDKVTIIPTYYVFTHIFHWQGTWYPIIVPGLFGNAIMIFLLRQNFKSIPKDVEEAAMLDGAGPLRTLVSVMLPYARPTVITVALLQFFYYWNEVRVASLYLGTAPKLYPIAFWLRQYSSLGASPAPLQASALMVMVIPVLVLFLTQRVFLQGVIVTGSEK